MKPPRRPSLQRPPDEQWQEVVRQHARTFAFPPTPDVADAVMARLGGRDGPHPSGQPMRLRPLWIASILLALLIGLLAVPPVRAAILEFLQIGAVRIWLVEPTPAPAPATTLTPMPPATASSVPSNTQPAAETRPSHFDLAGATTLAGAEAEAGFSIRLPTYPADLGHPDNVFYQELGGPVVVLVWADPDQPQAAQLSLHILGKGAIVDKGNPPVVMTTTVNGTTAAWTEGPYLLAYRQDGAQPHWEMRQLVSGRVLIWMEDGLTYRLESNLSLEEAVQMAESLE